MARELHRRGILTKLRRSAGQDIQAGCGQLRARTERGDERGVEIARKRLVRSAS
jgi:23S rRNA (adenine2503-C2)-methyltransferase